MGHSEALKKKLRNEKWQGLRKSSALETCVILVADGLYEPKRKGIPSERRTFSAADTREDHFHSSSTGKELGLTGHK